MLCFVTDFIMICMQKFDFNKPINVTLIVEDEVNQYPESIGTQFNNLCESTRVQHETYNSSRDGYNNNGNMTHNIYNPGFRLGVKSNNMYLYKRQLIYKLDRLSESIIQVANNVHNIYKRLANVSYENERVASEITLKKQEFYNSISGSTTGFILKQEKNYAFMSKFISRTVEIAHLKSFYHITSEIVKTFVVDLISWTKHKYQSSLDMRSKPQRYEIKSQHKSQANKSRHKTTNASKQTKSKQHNSVRIFSYGSSENQITLDIDSQLLQHVLNSNTERHATK